MTINYADDKIVICDIRDFDLTDTLECGQCFNFEKVGEGEEYIVVAYGRMIHVIYCDRTLTIYNAPKEDLDLWIHYFDIKRDYSIIKSRLIENALELTEVIRNHSGIRILNQEFYETLISFIISQNKQIPHIKQIIRHISEKYGKKIGEYNGREYYAFPSIEQLNDIGLAGYMQCKAGFRAPYLVDASHRLLSLNRESFADKKASEAKNMLKEIKGVGDKVANCVLLFGLGYREAFPIDVWVYRAMIDMYFDNREVSKDEVARYAEERFGNLGGYAQQYIFIYYKLRQKT